MSLQSKSQNRVRFCFLGLLFFSLLPQYNFQENAGNNMNQALQTADTGFFDENGNKYETASYNFCPSICSCLDDYFECKKANLKQVPALPKWVRSLDLTGNKLGDNVKDSIANLTELITLNLKKNRLQRIPVFKGLLSLEKLVLAHNKIRAITKEFFLSLPNLRELDLSKNAIRTILPNTFPSPNHLTSLNLNFNSISSLEESSFEVLGGLVDLQVNHNRLKSLPANIFRPLSNLKKLDLSDNHIEITWSTFKGLDELRILKLRSNGVGNLTDGVFHALKSVATMELDSNRITTLNRQGFYNLTSLITLTLSNNFIGRIEADTWEFTQQLTVLDLSFNNLTELNKQHLEFLNKLQRLNLGHNNIQYVADGTFDNAKNLEQLQLNNNKLSWLIEDASGPFKSLRKLQKLDLSSNNATSINQRAFVGLQSVQLLNLGMNNFTTIQFNAFEPLQYIEKLTLQSDHFICDCNLQWLYNWLKLSMKISEQVRVMCDYPVNLRGKFLMELKDEQFVCSKEESPKPRMIKEPGNQLAIKGTNVTLECSAIASAPADMVIQWRRDNIDILSNEIEIQAVEAGNNTITSSYLHLRNVNHDHTGKYQCSASNTFGTTYSQKFKITVATYPGFLKIPSNVTLNAGNTARLDCSAYGEPSPQIAWQKDGGNDFPAARERRMHVMPTDDAFFIINAKTSDMGVYTCTAENPAGIIRANATLTVQEAPTFVKPMRSKEVSTGQSSVLECMSSGSPKPTLRWYKDDQPLHLSERHFFAAESQLLIIVDTKFTDSGVYRCEMENELGTVSGLLTLKVNRSMLKGVVNVEEVTGIVIITVFCCAVGTSVIWVVIIYQTKRSPANVCGHSTNPGVVDYNSNMPGRSAGIPVCDAAVPNDNYLQIQMHDEAEARYRLIMPIRSLYSSQVISTNNIMTSGDGPDVATDNLSNKDSGKPSSNSEEDLALRTSHPHLSDSEPSGHASNTQKPIVLCRPNIFGSYSSTDIAQMFDNNVSPQCRPNQKQSKDDFDLELSAPLIRKIRVDDSNATSSISVPQNSAKTLPRIPGDK